MVNEIHLKRCVSEKFVNTSGLIRSRKRKMQLNHMVIAIAKRKRKKRKNNDLQNTTKKTKDRATLTILYPVVHLCATEL
jgi:hypothetical protein